MARPIGMDRLLKIIARIPQIILAIHNIIVIVSVKNENMMLNTLSDVETMPLLRDAMAYFFKCSICYTIQYQAVLSPFSFLF